jgi:hypothetical protein
MVKSLFNESLAEWTLAYSKIPLFQLAQDYVSARLLNIPDYETVPI